MKKHKVIVLIIIAIIIGFFVSKLPVRIVCKIISGDWDYQDRKCVL